MMTVEAPPEFKFGVVVSSSTGAREGNVGLEDDRRGSTGREKPATPSIPMRRQAQSISGSQWMLHADRYMKTCAYTQREYRAIKMPIGVGKCDKVPTAQRPHVPTA